MKQGVYIIVGSLNFEDRTCVKSHMTGGSLRRRNLRAKGTKKRGAETVIRLVHV